MTFNPILQLLKNMEKQCHCLREDLSLITFPYVDDKRKQQKYINLVNDKDISIGMNLKPNK